MVLGYFWLPTSLLGLTYQELIDADVWRPADGVEDGAGM